MNRALVVSLAALLATLPFSHTAALVRLLLAIAAVSTLVLLARGERRWKEIIPPFAPSFLAWVGWAAMSLGWSVDPSYTASELRSEFMYAAIVMLVAQAALLAEGSERVMLPVLATISTALALLSTGYFLAFGSIEAVEVPFGGPANLSTFVLILFPVACAAALVPGAGPMVRRLGFAMGVALLVAALTTLNRTVFPALAVEIMLVALLVRPIRRDAMRLLGLGAIALALAVAQVVVAQHLRFGAGTVAGNEFAEHGDPRPALWADVIERIEAKPLTGHGYGRGILRNELQQKFDSHLIWHAHNIFLDAGLQLGIPGIVLVATLFLAVALIGWRYARVPDPVARLCGAALVAIVAGMVVRNFTDDLLVRQNALLFWAIVGGLIGLGMRRVRVVISSRRSPAAGAR